MIRSNDVVRNIQMARSQIDKLKEQMNMLTTNNEAINNYAGIMNYSIGKIQAAIDNSIARLPQIRSLRSGSRNSVKLPVEQIQNHKAYKRLKKFVHGSTSTGNDRHRSNSRQNRQHLDLSMSIVNRPMRMLSFVEKHVRLDYQTDIKPTNYKLDMSMPARQIDLTQLKNQKPSRQLQLESLVQEVTQKKKPYSENNLSVASVPPLEYREVVDKFSLHHIMVRKGKTVQDTPQFSSYRRIYDSIWKKLKFLLEKIEQLMQQHNIQLAWVDGKRLAVLAVKSTYSIEDLIHCLVDSSKYLEMIVPKSKFKGVQGKLKAILMIQRFWRMHSIRTQYLHFKKCVIKIQVFMKKIINKQKTRRLIHQRNEQLYQNFLTHQKELQKNYKDIAKGQYVELHVNSFSLDEMKRLTTGHITQKKNLQLTRLFRLKDPKLTIILVCPNELPQEVISYYMKILQLSEVENYRDRLHLVVPEAGRIFSDHMSTSKLLYYSPKCLAKIRKIIKDRPCFMISGYPCNDTIKISQFLGVHLLSGDPKKAKHFSTKSQARRLFESSDLAVPPGVSELYDIGQFYSTFALLIINNREVQTWVVKIDDEYGGRGIATVDVSRIRELRRLLRENPKPIEEEPQQIFQTVPFEQQQEYSEQLMLEMKNLLVAELPKRLRICMPQLYHNYQEFMARLVTNGGCIEAYPVLRKEDLKSCSVSFFSSPAGQCQIICTYQKIQGPNMVNIGCSYPQQSLSPGVIEKATKNISEALHLRGMFGYFTLDFLAFKEEKEEFYRYWAIGLDCFLNTYTCSYFYFEVLMGGRYLMEDNQYIVEESIVSNNAKDPPSSSDRSVDTMITLDRPLKQRKCLLLPYVYHELLNTIKMKAFFKMARLQNISYDIKQKKGVCLILVDQLSTGVVGFMSIHQNTNDNIQQLYRTLTFISKLVKNPHLTYGQSEMNSRTDQVHFRDIMSKINSMRRKLHRTNFKQEAIKRNLINCNLQLIL